MRERNKQHLAKIAQLPCVICGSYPVHVAHIRYSVPDKPNPGVGQKPDDRWTVPLCPACHLLSNQAQHSRGERAWWWDAGLDAIAIAVDLYHAPNMEAMYEIVSIANRRQGYRP